MGTFHVGTSGWSYNHWKNLFYPKEISSGHFLEYYAEIFSAVELNVSFYRLPKPETIKNWIQKTPSCFFFCPKVSRLITHVKKLKGCEDLLNHFLHTFEPMEKKLGPFLIQLPPTFSFSWDIEPFFSFILKNYSHLSFAIETRHDSWITRECLEFLTHYKIAWVIADAGKNYPSYRAATAKHVYFRFHGPKALYASNYTPKQLKVFVDVAKDALYEGRNVWAFFNNDAEAYAPQSALLFQKLVNKVFL